MGDKGLSKNQPCYCVDVDQADNFVKAVFSVGAENVLGLLFAWFVLGKSIESIPIRSEMKNGA